MLTEEIRFQIEAFDNGVYDDDQDTHDYFAEKYKAEIAEYREEEAAAINFDPNEYDPYDVRPVNTSQLDEIPAGFEMPF